MTPKSGPRRPRRELVPSAGADVGWRCTHRACTVRWLVAATVALGLLLAVPSRVEAHARITSVLPAPSSTVAGPLRQVVLR